MAATTRKRKASSHPEEPEKRQRIAGEVELSDPQFQSDDEEEDDYEKEFNDFSDNARTADTPATPFSPGRKKFPSELKTLKCTWPGCTKTFNRPIRLETHLKIHTNERTFICVYEDCDKAYFEDKHLQAHIKGSHTHERKHHCDWEGCTKSFLTATRLRRHLATHQGHERFRCRDYAPCNETFRKHQTLQRHIRSQHLQLAPYPCKFVDFITKEPCNAGFDGASGLRRHEETAHGAPQFFCANCVIPFAFDPDGLPIHPGFTTKAQLQSHIRKEHANTSCIFCDLKCSNERQLQIHIDSQHSGTALEDRKNVRCSYIGCDRTFTKTSNLNTHIRSAHLGERFICGEAEIGDCQGLEHFDQSSGCGQDFVSKQFLADHVRIAHLGQKSLVNGKRLKSLSSAADDDFIDDEEDEDYKPKSRKSKKTKNSKISVIDQLTGRRSGPTSDSASDGRAHILHSSRLPPAVLQNPHVEPPAFETWQDLSEDNALIPVEGAFEEDTPLDSIDWALEQQALQGGAFWVGSGGNDEMANLDLWGQEEREMRMLIGDDYEKAGRGQGTLYPDL